MKRQLHRHVRESIDTAVEADEQARANWCSGETRARIAAFLAALK